MGMYCLYNLSLQKATWTQKNGAGGSSGDANEDNRGGLIVVGSETGDWIILSLRPQSRGRSQRRVTPVGNKPFFPCSTTMTTLLRGGALRITILSEGVVGGSGGKMRERWCG